MNIDLNRYSQAIKSIESSGGNYSQNLSADGVNHGGHALGAYQFIPSTLASVGATRFKSGQEFNSYVNQEYKKNPAEFDAYCKGRSGAVAVSCRGKYMLLNRPEEVGFDRDGFINRPEVQDHYFQKLTESNYQSGAMSKYRNESPEEVGRRLALMHFTGNPNGHLKGGQDLYGTTSGTYLNRYEKYYNKPLQYKGNKQSFQQTDVTNDKQTNPTDTKKIAKEAPVEPKPDQAKQTETKPTQSEPTEPTFSRSNFYEFKPAEFKYSSKVMSDEEVNQILDSIIRPRKS